MGGCATKPKVLQGDDAPEPQMRERQTYKEEAKREPIKDLKPGDTAKVEQQSDEKVVKKEIGENRTAEINNISDKVNEIAAGDDKVEDQGVKRRRSLSLLFDKESLESNVVTQSDNAPPEELKRQELMGAEKIIGETQSNETLKQEATNDTKCYSACGEDKEVPLETRKASGETESVEPVRNVPAEQDPPAKIVKNERPTEPPVGKSETGESFESSEQEPREFGKVSNDPVKKVTCDVNETSGEPDTKFVVAETKLEEPSNVNETAGLSDTNFGGDKTKLEEPSNINEIAGQSDTKFGGAESKLEEPYNVNKSSGQSDVKFAQAETVENPVEQTGTAAEIAPPEKDMPEHTNQSVVEVQSDDKIAKETTKTSIAPRSESSDADNKTSGETHSEPSDANNKTSGEPDGRVPEVKPLEKPDEQIGLALALAPSEEEATEHNNQSALVVQNDDKPAKATRE